MRDTKVRYIEEKKNRKFLLKGKMDGHEDGQ